MKNRSRIDRAWRRPQRSVGYLPWLSCLLFALAVSGLSACQRDRALISVSHTGGSYWDDLSLRIEVAAGVRARELEQSELRRDENGHMTTGDVETPVTGTVVVRFWLRGTDGTSVSEGSVELPLAPDWRWDVELRPSSEDPRKGCIGCFGSKSFPLHARYRPTGQELLWAYWGGNSLEHPVVY